MSRIPGGQFARNLIQRRALVSELVRRDFQMRYTGSAAGWLWGIVHPLVQLLVWRFVFETCLGTTLPPEEVTTNYTLFVFCGYLPWMLFQETVIRSAGSLVEQSNLITRTVFPAEVIAVSIFLSSLIHHFIGLGLAVGAVAIVLGKISPMILLLPFYMLLVGLLAVGVGWVVSSLHVYLRDTGQVVSVVMNLWFWMTPIMIDEHRIPQNLRFLIRGNPLSWVVRAYRESLMTSRWPHPPELAVLVAYSCAVFLLGGLFFRHLKRGFADVL